MKALMGHGIKNAVLIFVVATLMAQYPYVLSLNIVRITPLGGRRLVVKGVVEFQRGSEGWIGPENFYWFDMWWQSEEATNTVLSGSHGLIQLHSINWALIEEK